MVCLSRPYHFKLFKDCLPQILLRPFLNTLSHISCSTMYGYLLTEHFNKAKRTVEPFHPGYSIDIHAVGKYIKTLHVHHKLRKRWLKKLNLYTSQSLKEIIPGYKRWNFEPA